MSGNSDGGPRFRLDPRSGWGEWFRQRRQPFGFRFQNVFCQLVQVNVVQDEKTNRQSQDGIHIESELLVDWRPAGLRRFRNTATGIKFGKVIEKR